MRQPAAGLLEAHVAVARRRSGDQFGIDSLSCNVDGLPEGVAVPLPHGFPQFGVRCEYQRGIPPVRSKDLRRVFRSAERRRPEAARAPQMPDAASPTPERVDSRLGPVRKMVRLRREQSSPFELPGLWRGSGNRDEIVGSVVESLSFRDDFVTAARETPFGNLAGRGPVRRHYVPNGGGQGRLARIVHQGSGHP